jgi:hypothetical protein
LIIVELKVNEDNIHTMGIMLIVFASLPYMDATSSWGFRNRRQCILVAASGMIYEFFAASCAALIWANSAPGAIHSLAFNTMMVASIRRQIRIKCNPRDRSYNKMVMRGIDPPGRTPHFARAADSPASGRSSATKGHANG